MRTGIIICIAIGILWAVIALIQLWFTPMDGDTFMKISITLGLIFVVVLVVTLVIREYLSEKQMKKDGYIDG
jgi:membrane protein CcdC involved in cytochrome C biogenesis